MQELTSFAGLLAPLVFSLPLALGLVWLGLLGAFRLLPTRRDASGPRRVMPEAPLTARRGPAQWAVVHAKELPLDLSTGSSR